MKIKRPSPVKSRAANKRGDDAVATTSVLPAETPLVPSTMARWLPWAIVVLLILLAAMVRIRFLEMPLERDEGEYAYAGQLLLQGIPPYREAFNMKFPGVYAAYAVIMAIFGQTIAGIHFGFVLLNAGTIILVFLLGRRLFSVTAGMAAAASYALLSVGTGVFGTQAHATHFVIAAALAATLLLLQARERESLPRLFLSSLLYGVAILMKQPGALFAIFGGLYLLVGCRKRDIAHKLGIFLLGLALPLLLTALALWHAGVFGRFWFWTVTYAREYAGLTSLDEGMGYLKANFPTVVGPNVQIWLLAAVGLAFLWWRKQDRSTAAFVSGFLACSFFAVCPGLYFREHYFILMLPAIALLAGSVVRPTMRITWLLFAAVLAISIAQQSNFLFRISPFELTRQFYGVSPFPEAIQIGNYLRTHSPADARIAVLGSEPEIYFYAHRRSATGYIYTYGMMEAQPFALAMQNEMIGELESARPEYVVFVNIEWSWLRHPNSYVKIDDWWNTWQPSHYRLAGVADILSMERTEYHWDHLDAYRQHPPPIAIYQRIGD